MPAKFIFTDKAVIVIFHVNCNNPYDFNYWFKQLVPEKSRKLCGEVKSGLRWAFDKKYYDVIKLTADVYYGWEHVTVEVHQAQNSDIASVVEPEPPKPAQTMIEANKKGTCIITAFSDDWFDLVCSADINFDAAIGATVPAKDCYFREYCKDQDTVKLSIRMKHFSVIAELAHRFYGAGCILQDAAESVPEPEQKSVMMPVPEPVMVREVTGEQLTLF